MAENIEKGAILYEGKSKKVFATNCPDYIILQYRDETTALNGAKQGIIENKGVLNNRISSRLFSILAKKGIKSHFVAELSEREMLCRKLSVMQLEVIARNASAGKFAKRLGIAEGTELQTTVFELSYKDDELGDPLINDYHAVAIGAASWQDLKAIYKIAYKVNEVLSRFFSKRGIRLIDLKLEFGKNANGVIILADEISPDTCRLWDEQTGDKLDKDRFRLDLGNVREAYEDVLKRVLS